MTRVRPFDVELATPLSTAHGRIERREGFFVGVVAGRSDDGRDGDGRDGDGRTDGGRTDDGRDGDGRDGDGRTDDGRDGDGRTDGGDPADDVRGVGEATPLPGWTESHDACERALDGVTDPEAALDALDDAPAARHGVEHAVADAHARAAGVSLAASLRSRVGSARDAPAPSVPVNATVGGDGVAETVAAAEAAVADGVDCLKLKVGVDPLDDDVARVRAVREAVGDVTLRLDANGAWDRETAARAVDAFAALGVAYVEQPLPADDVEGHAELRGRGVDIALDESLATHALEAVLARDAADVVVVKPMVLGGPVRAAAAARRATAAGVDPVVTTTVDAAPARTAAVHVAATVPDVRPCGLGTGALLAADVAPDPAPVVDGEVAVPTGPGTAGDAFDALVW